MSDPQQPSGPTDPDVPRPPSAPQPPAPAPYPGATSGQTPPPPGAPGYGQAPGAPGYGQAPSAPGYGQAPGAPGYGQAPGAPGYGQAPGASYAPYGGAGQAPRPSSGNGLAIASLAVGGAGLLLSWIAVGGVVGLVGLVLGIVALAKKTGGRVLAIVGAIVSALAIVVAIGVVVFAIVVSQSVQDDVQRGFDEGFEGSSGSSSSDAPSDAAEPTEEAAENAAFGEVFTYDDGISVSVAAPEPFTPGEYASGADQAATVVFSVTVQNDSTANFDPALVFTSVSSGGTEADAVYDVEQGVQGSPSTTVPAGQSVTWQEAFSVADPAQVVFEIAPGFDYDDAVFTS